MARYRSKAGPWFAFLAHPRDLEDARRGPGARFLRAHSADDDAFRAKLRSLPPTVAAEFHFGFRGAWGELVSVFRLPEEMTGTDAARAVAEGLRVAAARGARVVGLGALTSPATGGGLRLLGAVPAGVTLTTGNAYTAAVVRANVLEASRVLGLGRRARVAVVGCTGSVGVAASRLLADCGFRLHLVGRTAQRARSLLGELAPQASFGEGAAGLRDSDVAVLLTSDPGARLRPWDLRPGSVAIDCAQPANVAPEELPDFERQGVAVTEGGLVAIPGYTCGFDFRLSDPGGAFACLAETYLFAREGWREHSIGRSSAELARRLDRLAERRGIEPRPLRLRTGAALAGWRPVAVPEARETVGA